MSQELQQVPEVIIHASRDLPYVLDLIPVDAWSKELCLEAIKISPGNFKRIPKSHAQNNKFIHDAVKVAPDLLHLLPKKDKSNIELQELAGWNNFEPREVNYCAKYPVSIITSSRRNNAIFMIAVLEINGLALEYSTKSIQANRTCVLAAIKQNPSAIQFASKSLQREFAGDR